MASTGNGVISPGEIATPEIFARFGEYPLYAPDFVVFVVYHVTLIASSTHYREFPLFETMQTRIE